MDQNYHDDNPKNYIKSTMSICDEDDWNTRKNCPKNRNKSEYKNNKGKRENIRKATMSCQDTNDCQSYTGKNSIDQSDDRLSFENESKSFCNFGCYRSIFSIKKGKAPILHPTKKLTYMISLDDKDI